MRFIIISFLLLFITKLNAGGPTDITLKQANEMGISIKVDETRDVEGCTWLSIQVPFIHPEHEFLTEANISYYVFDNDDIKYDSPKYISSLSTYKNNFETKSYQEAYICIVESMETKSLINISYSQDFFGLCKYKGECRLATTCYTNWSISINNEFKKSLSIQ